MALCQSDAIREESGSHVMEAGLDGSTPHAFFLSFS